MRYSGDFDHVQDEFEEFEEPDWVGGQLFWPMYTTQETPAPGTSEGKQWEEDWDDAGWDDEDQARRSWILCVAQT